MKMIPMLSAVGAVVLCGVVPVATAQETAAPATSAVRINEILFDPIGEDTGKEWIELYNASALPVNLSGWTITNRSGRVLASLPDWLLPSKAYLVVRFAAGRHENDFSDGSGTYYAGRVGAVLGNAVDEVALYKGPPDAKTIVDFLAYAFLAKYEPGKAYEQAVAAQIWREHAVFDDVAFVAVGNSIGRNAAGKDTDSPDDWYGDGGLHGNGPSPGAANDHELSYELTGADTALPLMAAFLSDIEPGDEQRVTMLKQALKQIREQHADLLNELDRHKLTKAEKRQPRFQGANEHPNAGMGDAQATVQQTANGFAVVVGHVRFIFVDKLTHSGHDAAGLTYPPSEPGGTVTIEISRNANQVLWKMKDTLIHELIHAVIFQDIRSGYWKIVRLGRNTYRWTATSDKTTRKQAMKVHETLGYLTDLRLLLRLKREFPSYRSDIDERFKQKVKHMESFLKEAFQNLEGFRKNRTQEWDVFGKHLRDMLFAHREQFLRMKLIQFWSDGTLDPFEKAKIRWQVNQFNRLAENGEPKFTREQISDMLTKPPQQPSGQTEAPKVAKGPTSKPPKPSPKQPKPNKTEESPKTTVTKPAKTEQPAVATLDENERKRLRQVKQERDKLQRRVSNYDHEIKVYQKAVEEGNIKKQDATRFIQNSKERKRKAEEALKKFDEAHKEDAPKLEKYKQQLALVSPKGTAISLTKATVVRHSELAFVTPEGMQANAAIEYLSQQSDLGSLKQFRTQLLDHIAQEGRVSEQTLSIAELNQAAHAIDLIVREIDRQCALVAAVRRNVVKAGNDMARIAETLTRMKAPGATKDTAGGIVIESMLVFTRFADSILSATGPQAGEAVVKGGAVVDDQSGLPLAETTVTLTLEDVRNDVVQDGQSRTTRIVKTNQQGEFTVPVPAGTQVVSIRAGDEDLVPTDQPIWPDSAAHTVAMTDEDKHFVEQFSDKETQQLSPDNRQRLVALLTLISYDFERALKAKPDARDAQDIASEIADEFRFQIPRQRINTGLLFATAVLARAQSGKEFTRHKLLELESALRTHLEQGPEGNSFQKVLEALSPTERDIAQQHLSGDAELVVASHLTMRNKPSQIAIEVDGDPADEQLEQLRRQLQQLVQRQAGPDTQVHIDANDRIDFQLSEDQGGSSTLIAFNVDVRQPNGQPVKLDKNRLQQNLNAIERQPGVRLVEVGVPRVAYTLFPNDPHFEASGSWGQEYRDQWALRRIGFAELGAGESSAWFNDQAGQAVEDQPCIVAVIGSGVDWTHRELLGQMWTNLKEVPYNRQDDDGNGYVDDVFGWNFREGNEDVMDYGGHDTHIAGIIAARWNNGYGIAGVCPRARIMALKVANHLGQANSIDVSRAIVYAVKQGARVINISYGGEGFSRVEQRAVDYALAHDVLVVVAAGNEASNAQNRGTAACRGALTVAGTTVDDKRARFSNWGQPIDLSAPAMDVLSLRARGTDFLLYVGENENYQSGTAIVGKSRDLYRASGTSFAAPFVSGTAALIWSAHANYSAQQVRRMLLMGAEDVEVAGWDQYTGAGIVNASNARQADPDYYLFARITRVAPVRRDRRIEIDVYGQADGSEFQERWLQIGFGDDPGADDWGTVKYDKQSVADGLLGSIPASQFDHRGIWTVQVIVQDRRKLVRRARARLNLK